MGFLLFLICLATQDKLKTNYSVQLAPTLRLFILTLEDTILSYNSFHNPEMSNHSIIEQQYEKQRIRVSLF